MGSMTEALGAMVVTSVLSSDPLGSVPVGCAPAPQAGLHLSRFLRRGRNHREGDTGTCKQGMGSGQDSGAGLPFGLAFLRLLCLCLQDTAHATDGPHRLTLPAVSFDASPCPETLRPLPDVRHAQACIKCLPESWLEGRLAGWPPERLGFALSFHRLERWQPWNGHCLGSRCQGRRVCLASEVLMP